MLLLSVLEVAVWQQYRLHILYGLLNGAIFIFLDINVVQLCNCKIGYCWYKYWNMGSRLSRQSSLDNENFTKRRCKHLNSTGEGDRGRIQGGDFLFTMMLKSDKLPGMLRRSNHSPYVRRVAWIREIQKLLGDRRIDQASDVLKLLRKVRTNYLHWNYCVWIDHKLRTVGLHRANVHRFAFMTNACHHCAACRHVYCQFHSNIFY